MPIEIAATTTPTTLEGEPLNPNCAHCWLSLPLQHFMDKHPDKPRDELIGEMCEVVAELVASCGHDWSGVRPWGEFALQSLNEAIKSKFVAHDRARRQRN